MLRLTKMNCVDKDCPHYDGTPHDHIENFGWPAGSQSLNDPNSPPLEALDLPPRARPPGNPRVEGVLTFEEQWHSFVAQSSNPSMYTAAHRAVAAMGYSWAISAFYKFGKAQRPLP